MQVYLNEGHRFVFTGDEVRDILLDAAGVPTDGVLRNVVTNNHEVELRPDGTLILTVVRTVDTLRHEPARRGEAIRQTRNEVAGAKQPEVAGAPTEKPGART